MKRRSLNAASLRRTGFPTRPTGWTLVAHTRDGFSLMEVLLATAILMGSVVVLGELASIGRRQAQRGRELAEAQQRCELLLNELLMGLRPLTPVEQEPLVDPIATVEAKSVAFGVEVFDDRDPFAPEGLPTSDRATGIDTIEDTLNDDPDWLYSLRVEPLPEHLGLALLTVSVEQSSEKFPRPLRFELSRWIEDPSPDREDAGGAFNTQQRFTSTTGGRSP